MPKRRSSHRQKITEPEETATAAKRVRAGAAVVEADGDERVAAVSGGEHPYRILVETINDGAATLDSTGRVLYANNRFAEMLGVPAEKFVGAALQGHWSAAHRQKLDGLIAKAVEGPSQGELSLEGANGRRRLIRFAFNPVKNSAQQNICVVATEITELVEANEALRLSQESLRQLSARVLQLQDEERRRIARDLHDVTGQKIAIQSMALAQVLEKASPMLDAETRQMLLECSSLTKQMGEEIRTVSYLLHPPLLDELGLSSAVKWYAEGFERRTGITTQVDISSNFLRLPSDVEVTLFRVVQESLTNVHRYSGSTQAYVRVRVNDAHVTVEVGDYGKGMRLELSNQERSSPAPIGVGIQGMKERMRQLSGTLEIKSKPNEGTIVRARLPITEVPIPSPESEEAAGPAPSRESNSGVRQPGPGQKRILIADDHEMIRHGVRTVLQKMPDWKICGEAIDGREAVEKAAELRPDLVILDINMPRLNGLAAVKEILRDRPQTKVLVFTVHDSEQTIQEIRAAGAHECLSKGKAGQELLRVVKELLGPTNSSARPEHSHTA